MTKVLTDQGVVYEVEESVRRVVNLIDDPNTTYVKLTNSDNGNVVIIFKSHIVSIF